MRAYWIRILVGAAIVFGIGMVAVAAVKKGSRTVHEIAGGTGPITVPLAFIHFNVDGQRYGTLRQLKVFRDSLQHPSQFALSVSLTDSADTARLARCVLIAEVVADNNNASPSDFACAAAKDTAGKTLTDFGTLHVWGTDREYQLWAPAAKVAALRGAKAAAAVAETRARDARIRGESMRVRMEAEGDSMRIRMQALGDSIRRAAKSAPPAPPVAPR